ncbi:MAG: hypothetical protein L0Z50_15590 [Verrucomicrobiales bacterium]|nr:hypothetical protein [Verrucomicrobiales bacterium]
MSSVKEIESALTRLSLEDLQVVRDWLDDFIEDPLDVSDEFKAKIQRAKQEIAEGVYSRTRKPDAGP